MNIGVSGIITNEYNEILLILRNDTHTWAPPGGSLDVGELPTEGISREVEEETGLKTMPVRLVSIDYRTFWGRDYLQFIFRCIQSGGEIKPSEESLEVRYFKRRALPNMLRISRDQIEAGWHHVGRAKWRHMGVPWRLLPRWMWLQLVVYPRFARERRRLGRPAYVPPEPWRLTNVVMFTNDEGKILAQKEQAGEGWMLPSVVSVVKQPPWGAAKALSQTIFGRSIDLSHLAALFVRPDHPEMHLVWAAQPLPSAAQVGPGYAWVDPDSLDPNHHHSYWVGQIADMPEGIVYGTLD